MPRIAGLLDNAVATVERVQICKSDGTTFSEPHFVSEKDPSGLAIWQKLMIHAEEQAKVGGHPLHRVLVRRLREAGAAGATVLRGVRGFYADHEPFADRLLSLRRNVPVHVVVVDTPSNMQRWWPIIDRGDEARPGLLPTNWSPHRTRSPPRRSAQLKLASTPTAKDDDA